MPPAFAAAFLVGFVEWTCIEALRPYLSAEQRAVGVHVNLSRSAATPIGLRATAAVEPIEIEGRKLRFKVGCRDEAEVVCEGTHDRFVIDQPRFMARLDRKRLPRKIVLSEVGSLAGKMR
jgi:fluoroacetyl-CoA thioesterase